MVKQWDENMRILVRKSPQAFVDLIVPQARFIRERPHKLRSWQLEVDALLDVVLDNQAMLLHIEFQTYHDASIPERLLRYNVLVRGEYKLPVLSCVIYLLKDGVRHVSPLRWVVPLGKEVLHFHFDSIDVGNLTPNDIMRMGQPGLLPLLPLTRGGASRDIVQRMFDELDSNKQEDLALIGFTFASMVFKREKSLDQEWLIRSFKAMYDLIRDTPIYQEMTRMAHEEGFEKGHQKGIEEGIKEGIEQGEQKALRDTILDIIHERFPKLTDIAEQQIMQVNDQKLLRQLIIKISLIKGVKAAKQLLLQASLKQES